MPKFIKFGRFAIAYDDRPRQPKARPTPPPPSPPPPEHRSGWATFGKVVAGILGVVVVVIVLANFAPAPKDAEQAGAAQAAVDPNSPQGVCERQDVQELASKEARKIMLDPGRKNVLMLAMFGLVDPNDVVERLNNANVTFSNVHGITSGQNLVGCSAAMRIDDSDANSGQDIVQVPALAWTVKFADGNGDLTSTNFTVDVELSTVFEGMQINGKSADEFVKGDNAGDAQAQSARGNDAVQSESEARTAKDAPSGSDPSEAAVQAAGDAAARAASEAAKPLN